MLKRILLSFFIFLTIQQVAAVEPTSGREFWVSFYGWSFISDSIQNMEFFVLVSSKNGCDATISNPNTGFSTTVTVAPGSIQKVLIPYTEVYNQSQGDTVCVANKGVFVLTSDSAKVYCGNFQASSYDASPVFPLKSLGTSYRVISTNDPFNLYPDGEGGTYPFPNYSSFVVVATVDNTTVTFNLTDTVTFGSYLYLPFTDYTKTLMRGQSLTISGLSLLGSTVKSDGCNRIAVFSGNYCSNVPSTCAACDVLVEQMPPLNTWGKDFMVYNTLNRAVDSKIKIIPKFDSTYVYIQQNGIVDTTLLEFNDYIYINSHILGTKINSDKPISVTQLAQSRLCTRSVGDPMLMWINPKEQMVKEALFAATPGVHMVSHYVQVFTRTAYVSQTRLDGVDVSSSFVLFPQDPTYSVAIISISPTTHYLTNPSGFMAYVYGYDDGSWNTQESYGYSLSNSFYNLEDYFSLASPTGAVSNMYYATSDSVNAYSVNDTIALSRHIESAFAGLSWLVNGQAFPLANDTLGVDYEWKLPCTYLKDGINTVSMVIDRTCQLDTLNATVWLTPPQFSLVNQNTLVCLRDSILLTASSNIDGAHYVWFTKSDTLATQNDSVMLHPLVTDTYYVYAELGNYRSVVDSMILSVRKYVYDTLWVDVCPRVVYNFNGKHISIPGAYSDTILFTHGCDSIITLMLSHRPPIITEQLVDICHGQSYLFAGSLLNQTATYRDSLVTAEGCDSISILHLTVAPPLQKTIYAYFCENDYYLYRGDTLYSPGTYVDSLTTDDGCDSIVTLILTEQYTEFFSYEITIDEGMYYVFNHQKLYTEGLYTDTLVNRFGCDSIVSLQLNIKYKVIIPAGFSPNADGENDVFVIKELDAYPNNSILIFNRWGNKVYEGKPYMNNWDGKNYWGLAIGGNDLPEGTYFYILDLGDGSDVRKGYVYLKR